MLEMAINNVELGSLKDRVHIVTFCGRALIFFFVNKCIFLYKQQCVFSESNK